MAPTTEGLVVVTLAAQVKVVHKVVGLAEGQVTTKVVAHFQADQVMEMGEMAVDIQVILEVVAQFMLR